MNSEQEGYFFLLAAKTFFCNVRVNLQKTVYFFVQSES